MFGDTDIQASDVPQNQPVLQSPPPLTPSPSSLPPVSPLPTYVPKQKSPIGPLLLGFLLVFIVAAAIGLAYYKAKFGPSVAPSPSPSATATPTASPSVSPTATASATPKASLKPTSAIKPGTASPTATPNPRPTLDLYFGNPSAHVKQTIDEGTGDGRVINREYSSIQAGMFDEIKSSWTPRVTVCFHLAANEKVAGKSIKFSMQYDDKIRVEDNMGWIDMLEPGKIYDWCHDVTNDIGKHTAKLLINTDKSLKEVSDVNNIARVDWENVADNIAPNFALTGPFDWGDNGTCLLTSGVSDNVTSIPDLKIEQKIDNGNWVTFTEAQYCFKGNSGDAHSYALRMTDKRGNKSEQSKSFNLF